MTNEPRRFGVQLPPSTLHLALTFALAVCGWTVHAADLQAKTIDGQVIQGEYLGTENNIVRIKTDYGVVSIPAQNIVTLLAVSLPKVNGAASAPLPEVQVERPVFKEPRNVNLSSLLAARMPRIPEAGVQARIELFRLVRNYGDSSNASRQKIVRQLANYGLMAFPYIEGSYTQPFELNEKVEILEAVSGQNRPYSAQLFSTVHAVALAELARTATSAPELPAEIITVRGSGLNREQRLRLLAVQIRIIEGYASASGGPFNALFLFNVYKTRYNGEADPLLKSSTLDRIRLAQTANDIKNPATGWTPDDRVLMIEMALPLLFKDNDDLRPMAVDFLKKLLPDRHPKWDAEQGDWFEWWVKTRPDILRAK